MNDLLLLSLCAASIAALLVAGAALLWRARPTPFIRRLLLGLFAGELLLGLLQPGILPASPILRFHLNLGAEYRFAVVLAAAQLCMAGTAALILGLRLARTDPDRRLPAWGYRLYWLALGAGLFFLAADEYFVIHETNRHFWRMLYLFVGMAMALPAGLLLVTGRRHRHKYSLLLAGMAVMAISGLLLDSVLDRIVRERMYCEGPAWLGELCDSFILHKPVWNLLEEFSELAGVTLLLGALLLLAQAQTGRRGVAGRYVTGAAVPLAGALVVAAYVVWLWLLPALEFYLLAERLQVEYRDGALTLVGYRLEGDPAQPGGRIDVHLYWQAHRPLEPPQMRLSLHALTRPALTSIAQDDDTTLGDRMPGLAFIPGTIMHKLLQLTLPEDLPGGSHALMLRVWSGEPPWRELTGQVVSFSDRPMLAAGHGALRGAGTPRHALSSWARAVDSLKWRKQGSVARICWRAGIRW